MGENFAIIIYGRGITVQTGSESRNCTKMKDRFFGLLCGFFFATHASQLKVSLIMLCIRCFVAHQQAAQSIL